MLLHGQSSHHMGPLLVEQILPWVTAGLCQLAALLGELGEMSPSLQPETMGGNTALGLRQDQAAQFPPPAGFISTTPRLKHKRNTQKVPADSEGP